jgi:HEAT repeat protein
MPAYGLILLVLATVAAFGNQAMAAKPNDPAVLSAIERGSQYLARMGLVAEGGRAGMAVLGLLKTGTSPDDAVVQKIIDTKLLPKFQDGVYKCSVGTDLYYEAGVDLMVYILAHPEAHEKEIVALVKVILEGQHEEGYWTYPLHSREGDRGDTSITQYALLGLWDAQRSGVAIPNGVFEKAASWLAANQDSDGAFWYHPGNEHYKPTPSVVAAGSSNLLVCGAAMHGLDRMAEKTSAAAQDAAPRFGVLKRVDLSPTARIQNKISIAKSKHVANTASKMTRTRIETIARRGMEWLDRNWVGASPTYFRFYFYYALERACTLSGTELIGDHDWYDEISDALIKEQEKDGGWASNDPAGPVPSTAFALLFLSRATAKIMKGHGVKTFGGGLMIGGRGLPTNLSAVQIGADGLQVRKLTVPVDQLLSELENPKSTAVEEVQKSIVEQVELGDPEKLIGQRARLIRLTKDPRPEVRRTAIWALGRSATIHEVHLLIKAIDDPDYGVVMEANTALCWFSRRPNGFGRPADPVATLPENASDDKKEKAATGWRAQIRTDWREWFQNVRPYAERNLPIDLP